MLAGVLPRPQNFQSRKGESVVLFISETNQRGKFFSYQRLIREENKTRNQKKQETKKKSEKTRDRKEPTIKKQDNYNKI